ncbi:hypothetical protein Tco_0320413 [Tanacetum coccineum]
MNFSPKQNEVRQIIFENKLSVFAILESHVKDSNLVKLCTSIFKHWDWTSNDNLCNKGTRIILGWNHYDVDVTVINQTDQVIHTRIWLKVEKNEVFCSFIYAHNRYIQRRSLWNDLCMHNQYIRGRSWSLLGDFNASLFLADSTARSSTIDIAMRDFKECVEAIEVTDVQCSGLQFTWNQKPKGSDGILKKLDHVMANLEFSGSFEGAHVIFYPYRTSDHSPTVLKLPSNVKAKPKPFKFSNILVQHSRFKEVVEGIRPCANHDPSNIDLRVEEAAYVIAYIDALVLQERFLKQKAKINWLKDGDLNSAYFHKAVKSRTTRNRIDVVTNSDADTTQPLESHNLFDVTLDEGMALDMVRNVSAQEVKEAMFFMGNDKSPGPDGYTVAFFKEAWDIVGAEAVQAICEFFTNGKLLKELNHTIIALIPKIQNPTRVNDYRPISCCNVLFKCISKILANRIKESLKVLISPNQSAFVPGRNISDNILLTQELMHNYHLDRGVPRCTFKVDIQKAYDTLDWDFLRLILTCFGFHDRMVAWIMECVTTTSFSLSINGSLHGYFKGKRGLRQGDPLSPYLFTIVMEVLTLIIRRRVRGSNMFTYHRYCSKMELIKLCFTDDLFLFALGDTHSARIIMDALEEFKLVSGLVPSLPKSTAYFCNVLNHTKLAILQILPFEEGRLPVKYLGVPLVSSKLIFRDCKELIEKVESRLNDWKNKSLSIAGRLQLVQSVIASMHVFWASIFILPSRILLEIEQLMRGFLWCNGGMSRGKSKVA